MGRPPELIKSSTDLLVLAVLADAPLYGYAISKRIAGQSDGHIRISPGVLYPLLNEMEQQGLLLASWENVGEKRDDDPDIASPGRPRKWYRLSAKGKRRLAQRVDAHRAYQTMIESFLPDVDGSRAR